MGAVKHRIAVAQEHYDESSKQLDEQCKTVIARAKAERKANKEALADQLVDELLGKIL